MPIKRITPRIKKAVINYLDRNVTEITPNIVSKMGFDNETELYTDIYEELKAKRKYEQQQAKRNK